MTASCSSRYYSTLQSGSASWSCACFLGSTSSWSAARYQTVSFAGSDPGARGGSGLGLARGQIVTTACVRRFVVRTMCAVLGLVARQEDSGLRDHRVRVLISNHVTPFDHNIVNLLTNCSTVSSGGSRECHGVAPWGPAQGAPLRVRVFLGDHKIPLPRPRFTTHMSVFLTSRHSFFLAFSPSGSQPLLNSPPSFVCWSRGFMEMDGQGELVESLKRFCASTRLPPTPLLLFPEEEATNGREGLLRFRWVSTGICLQL